MKISIISVAFNEEKNIAKTIESVLRQTSTDYEYIICDGKSTDKTVKIAQSFVEEFKEKGVKYTIRTQEDKGIFDGMNKGIDLACGEYVYFLNAGDRLYDENVIKKIIDVLCDKNPDVLYGQCLCDDRGAGFFKNVDHQKLNEYMSLAHPATIVRADLIKQNKFDLEFKVASDYEMMLKLYKNGSIFSKTDIIISCFEMDGVSSKNIEKCYVESAQVREKYGEVVDWKQVKKQIKKEKRNLRIKSLIPKKLWIFWSVKFKKKIKISD